MEHIDLLSSEQQQAGRQRAEQQQQQQAGQPGTSAAAAAAVAAAAAASDDEVQLTGEVPPPPACREFLVAGARECAQCSRALQEAAASDAAQKRDLDAERNALAQLHKGLAPQLAAGARCGVQGGGPRTPPRCCLALPGACWGSRWRGGVCTRRAAWTPAACRPTQLPTATPAPTLVSGTT